MNISGVDFPEPLLTALRDGRLVVFAGAGVSMGPPARLPSFRRLAEQVAEGTGQPIGETEAEDRFLGRLQDRGITVHQRTAQILQLNNPEPTVTHCNLLRFFGDLGEVRTVTTNFDGLFEQAAVSQFNYGPRVFQAPALPLGSRFQGIVHLHGSVDEPEEMVLTHRDFGRAYLTESGGWARRFLVDLFANYTVLFVGYSHSDTIMTYLTPSLPPDGVQKRFAMIGDRSDDRDHWNRMGIAPIVFHQADAGDFTELNAALAGLANSMRRGILDWQQEITTFASGRPPIDDEDAGIIEHSLTTPELTRFFVRAAASPDWIDWLDQRGHLYGLFGTGDMTETDGMLVGWLASRFMVEHSAELFSVIERHHGDVNPRLWNRLAGELGQCKDGSLSPETLAQWVYFLLSVVPTDRGDYLLCNLAERCAEVDLWHELLEIYDSFTSVRRMVRPRTGWTKSHLEHYWEETLWTKCLQPNLPHLAETLLERTSRRLADRHFALRAWRQSDDDRDPDSSYRSAVEPHPQDRFPHDADMLIDIARDCLEWLVVNEPQVAKRWSCRYVNSKAPLLRRLAVHALSSRTDLTANDKIDWLLRRCNIHETQARHEIFRVARIAYPYAGEEQRRELISAILAYRWPWDEHPDQDRYSAQHQYDWLQWLSEANPACPLVQVALEPIRERYPEFVPDEHPDLSFWMGDVYEIVGKPSPWSVSEILAQPLAEWLPLALEQSPTEYPAHPRDQVIKHVAKATEQNKEWSFELADALIQSETWDSHLWRGIMQGWCSTDLGANDLAKVIETLSSGDLLPKHSSEIIDTLASLVDRCEQTIDLESLDHANETARKLWHHVSAEDQLSDADWTSRAGNHPAGRLAHFWVRSISIRRNRQEVKTSRLDEKYREALSEIVADQGARGKLARVMLMTEFPYLAFVDEEWAARYLIPSLAPDHIDCPAAWDGLTHCGRMTPGTGVLLRESFLNAVEKLLDQMEDYLRSRFITMYTYVLIASVTDAGDEWITKLFGNANDDDKRAFAMEIARALRLMDERRHREWWDTWLREYWNHRLDGVPVPLNVDEAVLMATWAPILTGLFPEAAELVTRRDPIPGRSWVALHGIKDSDLVERYPTELAGFMIHIGQADSEPWIGFGINSVINGLLDSDLPQELERGLRELVVRHDIR